MPDRIDNCLRLEPIRRDHDLENGFAARLHDPLWLLARQWQMGEHQGENASSPVRIDYAVTRAPIDRVAGNPAFDPTVVPAEAIVESELDDWWTMGRRVRIGARLEAQDLNLAEVEGIRFADPPPPYDFFAGRIDGRAVWWARERLQVPDSAFGDDLPGEDSPDRWNAFRLNYHARFESAQGPLIVRDHHGGPMDWYSADGDGAAPPGAAGGPHEASAIPTPMEYPGAPHSRFWEIEDARIDIGGYPPDTAHFATMLLVELVYSHGDDWFLFPITAHAGHVVTIRSLTVTDAFGRTYGSDELENGAIRYPGLHPPSDFSIFGSDGLEDGSLVLWLAAESPLESGPLERVQFGVDEHSNLLWALERTVDAREVERLPSEADDDHPPYPTPTPIGDATKARSYVYMPAVGIESRWHPYTLEWEDEGELSFVQRGLADYSRQHPRPMPRPQAEVLKAGTPAAPELHRIAAATISGGGLELERRWQLARDLQGRPVLWIQRQRRALRTPPALTIRFDVMEESAAESQA